MDQEHGEECRDPHLDEGAQQRYSTGNKNAGTEQAANTCMYSHRFHTGSCILHPDMLTEMVELASAFRRRPETLLSPA